jgi:hypothetical protein
MSMKMLAHNLRIFLYASLAVIILQPTTSQNCFGTDGYCTVDTNNMYRLSPIGEGPSSFLSIGEALDDQLQTSPASFSITQY